MADENQQVIKQSSGGHHGAQVPAHTCSKFQEQGQQLSTGGCGNGPWTAGHPDFRLGLDGARAFVKVLGQSHPACRGQRRAETFHERLSAGQGGTLLPQAGKATRKSVSI